MSLIGPIDQYPVPGAPEYRPNKSLGPGAIGTGFIFQENPYGNPGSNYEQGFYRYPLEMLGNQRLMNQNFDLQRQRAMGSVGAGVTSGQKTALTSLASSGGLSQADRQAIQAQSQRQRVNLSQGALSPYDQQAAQNMYDTERFNVGQTQDVMDYNAQIQNQKIRDMAVEKEKLATNLYQQRLREALLERQLDAARAIASKQG